MASDVTCPICTMNELLIGADTIECATCGHEWAPAAAALEVRDASGNLLADGDAVVLVQGVPLNGKPNAFKAGTKVKSIRLVAGDHEIDCKIDGRSILLKAQFVRKA